MITYILLITIIIYIILVLTIKIKLKFWSKQPVFHLHNLLFWWFPPGIINHSLPIKNKYTNFIDITFMEFKYLTDDKLEDFVLLIQKHYLNDKKAKYLPDKQNISPYFSNHKYKSFISLYYKPSTFIKNDKIQTQKVLVGGITGRPLQVYINNIEFPIYYIDHLCVDKSNRQKGIAPQLIQTHEYNQRHNNKIITASLFKREGNLTLIVPLVVYYTYAFKFCVWEIKQSLHPSIKLIKITTSNINLLVDFIILKRKEFDCFITTSLPNLLDLINSSNIYIYCLIQNQTILSAYFFRNSCTYYEKNKTLECFCCINNSTNIPVFVIGFSHALKLFQSTYSILLIENLGHTTDIIENILNKHTPSFVSKMAYYFYNFANRPIKEKRICIIN